MTNVDVAETEANPEVETADAGTADAEETEVEETEAAQTRRFRWLRGRIRLPKTLRMRVALSAVLVVVIAAVGGFCWLNSGQTVFGLRSGVGPLSFLPVRLPDNVAFAYGDRLITVDELNGEVAVLQALYGVQVPTDPTQLATFRRDAAKAYAVTLILDNAAKANGVVIADKTAQDTLTKFVTAALGNGPDAYNNFVKALGNAGTSQQAVLDELKRRLGMAQLFNTITAGTGAVTDQQVQDAFNQRRAQLGTPEQRRISNIVVQTQNEASQAVTAIRAGTPFATEAQQVSLDGSTRSQGGDLGTVSQSQLDPGYGKVAFAASVGQVFGPVQDQYGWNVGIVVADTPAQPATYAQVKDQLKTELQTERALAKWRTWLADQIRQAGIVYADGYRPADPTAPPDVSVPSANPAGASSASGAPATGTSATGTPSGQQPTPGH